MPPSPAYAAEPSNLPSDESDSDLEIDLEELDPQGVRLTNSHTPPSPPRRERPARIALRNLRMGGLRRAANRARGYGELGGSSSRHGDDDARGLLADNEAGPSSRRGSDANADDDDAPLLSQHQGDGDGHGLRRRSSSIHDKLHSLSSGLLRLPQLFSRRAHIHDLDDQDDDDPSTARHVAVGAQQSTRFPPNSISNAKYTPWSFLPVTLYNEFSFFFNMYFLLVALSQAIPQLRIGYLSTYIAPLAFVLAITLGKEAYDDVERRRRDSEANSEEYNTIQFIVPDAANGSHARPRRPLRSDSSTKAQRRRLNAERERLSDIQEEEERLEGDGIANRPQPSSRVLEVAKKSRDLRVGDVLKLSKGQRVPADVVLLKCLSPEGSHEPRLSTEHQNNTEEAPDLLVDHEEAATSTAPADPAPVPVPESSGPSGETFIRTDQLDGETDWKLRLASPLSQKLATEEFVRLRVTGGKPDRKVNEFAGTLTLLPARSETAGETAIADDESGQTAVALSIDNTAWANTVIASHATTLAVIVYTGPQTRSALSTAPSRSKTGLLEYEINSLTKILCALTLALSVILVLLEGLDHTTGSVWYVKVMRFLVLFSTIVPISLRVNLDLGKSVYSYLIQHDPGMPGAVVRTSTIPEDLGRIEYLLSDKTGTLTQNEMDMKKIHVGTVSYANEAMDEVAAYVRQAFGGTDGQLVTPSSTVAAAAAASAGATRTRREIGARVRDIVLALALCHNVTPTTDEDEQGQPVTSYQASSPDEIAIVRWTEAVGLRLAYRDRRRMVLEAADTGRAVVEVRILDVFPFTSEGKRMGIIVQFVTTPGSASAGHAGDADGEIWFYQKGADTVMGPIVAANDWLDEETANMAREGLRTLVVGRKRLSGEQYREFAARYQEASLALGGREAGMQRVVGAHLERDVELLGVTGVEDKLQRDVKPSLELLRNAGIKIWMLTGDKVETARCVAISAKLVARGQYIYTVTRLARGSSAAQEHLDFLRGKPDACLLVDGESLAVLLSQHQSTFIAAAVRLPAVVACRCSPTQKADMARLIRAHTRKRVCCIGDGGNDVSMIQAADVGVGIVGKEGRQASLAADFSITQFCHLTTLLVWHGRNSYKRSAKLAQFVIHRGLIIAVCQTMYSIAIRFEPEGLYKDWLMVGYATVYTALPVLSLVLDKDVDEGLASLFPELYKELTEGRSLSYRTFFVWVLVSVYQGCMIQGLAQLLTAVDGPRMVAVSYTALVLNELLMVAIEITTWHLVMVLCIVGTFLLYIGTIPFLGGYFDLAYILTLGFLWRVTAICAISLIPPYAGKLIRRTMKPPSYRKVQSI